VTFERDHGIIEFVVCRECGRKVKGYLNGSRSGHLRTHGWKSVPAYRYKWPDAPTVPIRVRDQSQRKWQEQQQRLADAERVLGAQKAKRKDDIADKVIHLKDVEHLSWAEIEIKLNSEAKRAGLETNTKEGFRSLYRRRR
jgi:hypothetical protein